ncbi:hypothetical protein BDV06DRAFT_217719 [Aspergillus oleicola]
MANLSHPSSYLLRRDCNETVRLESQHLLWKLHTGYTIHPDIPIVDGMCVADLGAGTGIWALELAPQLPPSARVIGYDISESTFPLSEYWPPNVSFSALDCLGEVPEALVGQFDVVHLRMWALVIRGNNPSTLIRNAAKLLKPGGYLQWEDAPFGSVVARGETALHVREMMRAINRFAKTDFRWLDQLQDHVQLATPDLKVVNCQKTMWASYFIPLCMNTFMLALEDSGNMLDWLRLLDPRVVPSQAEWAAALAALHEEMKKPGGGQYYWTPVNLLARKHS